MKPSEIVFDNTIKNRDKFGVYVHARRLELGMSLIYMAALLDLSKGYITDIEKGNRSAPQNIEPKKNLDNMIKVLKVEDEEIDYFYDLAGCTHGNWPEINKYLATCPYAREFLRYVRDNNIPAEEWTNIVINFKKDEDCEELEK